MNDMLRRTFVGLLALASIAVMGTALAWACSEGNRIAITKQSPAPVSGPPGSGPAGTEVTLKGEDFIGGEAVEIRWNELNGPLLAEATVPPGSRTFDGVKATIPSAAPLDTHVIIAKTTVTNKENGTQQTFVAKTPFTVTKAGAPAGGGGPGGGGPDAGSRPTSPGTPPTASPVPTSPGATPAPQVGGGNANGGARGGGRDSATVTGPGTGSTESNRAPRGGPTTGDSPVVATETRPSGIAARGDSTAGGAAADSAPPRGGAADSPGGGGTDRGAASDDVSASGDLWGGFQTASQRPSLSGAAGPKADTRSSLTVGMGLLGLGLVALFTAFGAADVRRRRRVASSAHGRSRQR